MSPTLSMPSCSSEFFGFSHRPFRGTPDPDEYIAIEAIDQEVQRLAAAAAQGDGIAVLTAAPGAGKTLVCGRLQRVLRPRFESVVLSSSGFATRRALLQAVLFSLGQSYENCSEQELRLSILHYAAALAGSHEGIVLIVDEAHLLNARLLEELRCLTNHSQSGRPLIRVVLCGQLPLEEALVNPALEALNYRITCHATLEPLSMPESARLIAGRLHRAGRDVEDILTPDALETICRVSDGNPRCLVQLCDESLRIAAERRQIPVEVETVRLALHQLKQLPLQWNESAVDRPQSMHSGLDAGHADADTDAWDADLSGADLSNAGDGAAFGVDAGAAAPPREFDPLQPPVEGDTADAGDEALPGWSSAMCSVELGADDVRHAAPEAAGGWSSYEPQSGWEPTAAARSRQTHESDGADSTDELCGDQTCAVPQPGAVDAAWSDPPAGLVSLSGPVASEPGPPATMSPDGTDENGFVELPVEDPYAALDARKGSGPAACDADAFARMLCSSLNSAPHPPAPAACEPIADADPPGRPDAAVNLSDGLQKPSLPHPDKVITDSGAVPAGSPGVPVSPECEWQSAGDCRDYDIVDPDGEPQWDDSQWGESKWDESQWDESVPELLRHRTSGGVDVVPPAGATRSQAQRMDPVEAPRQSSRRPYARLFSRARQRPS